LTRSRRINHQNKVNHYFISSPQPQYEGNTTHSATDPAPSTHRKGFIIALSFSPARHGAEEGTRLAVHGYCQIQGPTEQNKLRHLGVDAPTLPRSKPTA